MKTASVRGRHRQRHRLQHGHQGLPGASRERPVSACCAAILPTPRKYGCAASSSTAMPECTDNLSFFGATAFTDGKYISFPDAPPPLEDTGGPQVKDISGSVLPGISRWAFSLGGEYVNRGNHSRTVRRIFRRRSTTSYRSSFLVERDVRRRYLVVDGYALLNARVGFRWADGWTVTFWSRNLLDKDYFELLSAAPGNTGPFRRTARRGRTVGVTMRMRFDRRGTDGNRTTPRGKVEIGYAV